MKTLNAGTPLGNVSSLRFKFRATNVVEFGFFLFAHACGCMMHALLDHVFINDFIIWKETLAMTLKLANETKFICLAMFLKT